MPDPMRRTALFEAHRALGARLVPFGGFEMPVTYTSILREHAAVRHAAGLFDLSHMAQFTLSGDAVGAWADELTINFVANMKLGQARYNIFTNPRGGAHDDVIFYRLDAQRWLLVVNASNASKMAQVLSDAATPQIEVVNNHGARALIAIQGPRSVDILRGSTAANLADMAYYNCIETRVAGIAAVVARTGYTGEDGFEMFCAVDDAVDLWDALLAAGRPAGLEPVGLGARDVLRLEAGMPLYGHELTEDITPVQAGLTWALKLAKPSFPGRSVLEEQLAGNNFERIAGLVLDGKVPARSGYPVFSNGLPAGVIRSGSTAPSLGNKNIATALMSPSASVAGSQLEVEIRGVRHGATVVSRPFYKRSR